jgi:VCBS repeat protein
MLLTSGEPGAVTHSDILWRDVFGDVAIWSMNGATVSAAALVGNLPNNWTVAGQHDFNGDWRIVGTGDFNSDGKSDILYRDGTGDVAITLMNGTTISTTAVVGQVPNSWSIAETGDFNGDGMSDILLRDNFGNVGVWLMNGTTVSKAASIGSAPTIWAIETANAD